MLTTVHCAGEELSVGTSLNNYLSFEVRLTGSTSVGLQGNMALYWPGAPGGGQGSGCTANVTWPMLTAITILGSGPVNTASVSVTVSIPKHRMQLKILLHFEKLHQSKNWYAC